MLPLLEPILFTVRCDSTAEVLAAAVAVAAKAA